MMNDIFQLFKKEIMEYLNFSGKMSQRDYTIFNITVLVLTFVVGFISGLIGFIWLIAIVQLALIIPVLSSQIRRCRDIGLSPWVCLLHLLVIGVVPIGSFILMVGGMLLKSNQFGDKI